MACGVTLSQPMSDHVTQDRQGLVTMTFNYLPRPRHVSHVCHVSKRPSPYSYRCSVAGWHGASVSHRDVPGCPAAEHSRRLQPTNWRLHCHRGGGGPTPTTGFRKFGAVQQKKRKLQYNCWGAVKETTDLIGGKDDNRHWTCLLARVTTGVWVEISQWLSILVLMSHSSWIGLKLSFLLCSGHTV